MPQLRLARAVVFIAMFAVAARARAQGDLEGRVLTDAGRTPVAGANIRFAGLDRAARTDSAGRFALTGLRAGAQRIVIGSLGFRPETVNVMIPEGQIVVQDFTLTRVATTTLGEVKVTGVATKPKMSGFDDRRRQGIGRFIDREMLSKVENRSTSMILATVPGLAIWHGAGTKAWAFTTRSANPAQCAFCKGSVESLIDKYDVASGARPACYMDVYLDGSLIYQYGVSPPMPLFDINSVPTEQIEGIEAYTSASQVPAQYNRTSTAGCGVIVIWTRISK